MTRGDLIVELAASHPHLRQADIELIVTAVFDQLSRALANGQRVELRGFGSFATKRRAPRTARNPRTGAEVAVAAKVLPSFRMSREMLARLNRPAKRKGS